MGTKVWMIKYWKDETDSDDIEYNLQRKYWETKYAQIYFEKEDAIQDYETIMQSISDESRPYVKLWSYFIDIHDSEHIDDE